MLFAEAEDTQVSVSLCVPLNSLKSLLQNPRNGDCSLPFSSSPGPEAAMPQCLFPHFVYTPTSIVQRAYSLLNLKMVPPTQANGYLPLAPSVGTRQRKEVKCYTEESALGFYTDAIHVYTQHKRMALFGVFLVLKRVTAIWCKLIHLVLQRRARRDNMRHKGTN